MLLGLLVRPRSATRSVAVAGAVPAFAVEVPVRTSARGCLVGQLGS